MGKFLKLYDSCIEKAIAILLGFLVVIVFAQVISRYIFNFPIMWAEEVGRYTFIWVVYLGAAVAFKERAHLVVDILTQKMPYKLQFYLNKFFEIIILLFLSIIFIYGLQFSIKNMGNLAYSADFFSLGIAYASIPVGALFMIINIIRVMFEDFKIRRENKKEGAKS